MSRASAACGIVKDGDVQTLSEEIYIRDMRTARENVLRREALVRDNLQDHSAECPPKIFRPAGCATSFP